MLALQGDAEPHAECLRALGEEPRPVRRAAELEDLTHLVLPGGESTTIAHLIDLFGLRTVLVERARSGELALFGTCAGAILLGREDAERPARFGLLDAEVRRNAYGRQIDSFTAALTIDAFETEPAPFPAVFIRAPRFGAIGPGVRVLSEWNGAPVLVEAPGILAATFHPELTGDLRLHRYFLENARAPVAGARP